MAASVEVIGEFKRKRFWRHRPSGAGLPVVALFAERDLQKSVEDLRKLEEVSASTRLCQSICKGVHVFVEAIMALVRLSDTGEAVVSDLAKAILILVEELRDTNLRAEMAEAALESEMLRIGDIRQKLAHLKADDPVEMSRMLRELTEVVSA